jgi:hypothetical protein
MPREQLGAELEQLTAALVDLEADVGGLRDAPSLPVLLTDGR